jgi:hypothetical protein
MKNPFQKRQNKSKDQIAWEMKQQAETQRKRTFIAEHFFPMLLEHMKTVTQAKNFCKVVQNDIHATFNAGMVKPVGELKMAERFEGEDNEAQRAYKAVLEVFKDTPIKDAMELLDGMPHAIDAALQMETKDKLLSELEWGDGALTIKHDEKTI